DLVLADDARGVRLRGVGRAALQQVACPRRRGDVRDGLQLGRRGPEVTDVDTDHRQGEEGAGQPQCHQDGGLPALAFTRPLHRYLRVATSVPPPRSPRRGTCAPRPAAKMCASVAAVPDAPPALTARAATRDGCAI